MYLKTVESAPNFHNVLLYVAGRCFLNLLKRLQEKRHIIRIYNKGNARVRMAYPHSVHAPSAAYIPTTLAVNPELVGQNPVIPLVVEHISFHTESHPSDIHIVKG